MIVIVCTCSRVGGTNYRFILAFNIKNNYLTGLEYLLLAINKRRLIHRYLMKKTEKGGWG